jgi:O-antigen ligase
MKAHIPNPRFDCHEATPIPDALAIMEPNPRNNIFSAASHKAVWHTHAPIVAIVLWLLLWINLDTGFWLIVKPDTIDEWISAIRACLPFLVLPVSAFLLIRRSTLALPGMAPSRLLLIYGILAAISGIFSPQPLWAAYWSVTYVATILTAWTFVDGRTPVESARTMLLVTWVFTFLVAAYLGYTSSTLIFGHPMSAYSRPEAGLDKMSRASGVARWAAVPGLVCVVRAFYSRRPIAIVGFLAAACFCFFLVFRMQSRGAVFGCIAAIVFSIVLSTRMRRYALPSVILLTVFLFLLESPGVISQTVSDYLRRGQSDELFESMSGRTHAYEHGMRAFADAPIFGRGQWTDRLVFFEHVHNSFLQALLNGGIVGAMPYFASWITGWVMFFRLRNRWKFLSKEDQLCLLESGTVMMFFTVRAIPETTTASFAVDLLVMVAVYVYLETLTLDLGRRQVSYSVQSTVVLSGWSSEARPLLPSKVISQR